MFLPARNFVLSVFLAAGLSITAVKEARAAEKEIPVTAIEDLMREHGLLNRILLIYEDAAEKLRSGQEYNLEILFLAAQIVKRFIEDYHEKLEENHIFPMFEKRGLSGLANVLKEQHEAGRKVTDEIIRLTGEKDLSSQDMAKLTDDLRKYIRMYRPHEAMEDTVLFPAFHGIISSKEYARLGREFEKEEERMFGEDGFGKTVANVASLEDVVGLGDISQHTPKPPPQEFI